MAVIRESHRWAALFLILATLLHALRGLLIRAHRPPRHLNWWSGLVLLSLVIMTAGNGYLLRWDIKAFALYSLMLETLQSAGDLGELIRNWILPDRHGAPISLVLGYSLHTWILPAVLFTGLAGHLALVARHGDLTPIPQQEHGRPGARSRWVRALLPSIVLLAAVVGLGLLLPTDPGSTDPYQRQGGPNPDWLLLFCFAPYSVSGGVFSHPVVVAFLITLTLLALAMPWLDRQERRSWLSIALVGVGLILVSGMLVQTGRLGQGMPLQGCPACHNDRMEGGPVHTYDIQPTDPAWLLLHMQEPVESILSPATPLIEASTGYAPVRIAYSFSGLIHLSDPTPID